MRVYVFTEYFPNPYKPYFDEQFAALLRRGHDLRIFAQGKFDEVVNEQVRSLGLDARTTYYPTTGSTTTRFLPAILARALLHPIISVRAAGRCWTSERPAKANLLDTCRMMRLPSTPPDLCFIHDLAAAQRFTFLRRLYPGVPVALHFHGGEIPFQGTIDQPKRVFAAMDVVFTNTEYSKALAIARGCDPGKILINPVGFQLDRYVPEEPRLYRRGGVLRLVSVGRLSEEKGHLDVLRAIRTLADGRSAPVAYRIVGNGPWSGKIEAFIREHRLESLVTMVGPLPKSDVLRELEAADVLLQTSVPTAHCEENQACAMQEAMLMRTLVLTTRTGGVQESIAEAMRTLAVDCGDADAIAEKLRSLMTMPAEDLDRLGRTGRQFVRERYDVERVTAFVLDHVGAGGPR